MAVRNPPVVENLPAGHTKRPHIRLNGADAGEEGLWGCPAHRKAACALAAVVVAVVEVAGEPVVGNADGPVLTDENVAGSQITMHDIVAGEIAHALCRLTDDAHTP